MKKYKRTIIKEPLPFYNKDYVGKLLNLNRILILISIILLALTIYFAIIIYKIKVPPGYEELTPEEVTPEETMIESKEEIINNEIRKIIIVEFENIKYNIISK